MTSAWQYRILPGAARRLRRADPDTRRRIIAALDRLVADPSGSAGDVAKLRGQQNVWRLRVGDWRVLFERDATTHTIDVVAVAPRGEAYRD